jgi:hypothetical protein
LSSVEKVGDLAPTGSVGSMQICSLKYYALHSKTGYNNNFYKNILTLKYMFPTIPTAIEQFFQMR